MVARLVHLARAAGAGARGGARPWRRQAHAARGCAGDLCEGEGLSRGAGAVSMTTNSGIIRRQTAFPKLSARSPNFSIFADDRLRDRDRLGRVIPAIGGR